MQKKFITNLALLVFLNLLVKPFWIFGIDREVQNTVNANQYGLYFSLFGFSMLLNIILDMGITNFNNRNISQNNQLLGKHFSNIVIIRFFLGIFYSLLCFGIGFIIGYDKYRFKLLFFLVCNQFLLSFILYLRSNLAGLHLFRTDSLISVLDRVLMILICSVLLWGNVTQTKFRIEWFVYSQTFSYTITALVTFFIVLSKARFLRLKFNYTFFLVIMKQSYPFAVLTLLMAFYNRIDSVMLERMLVNGKQQAGIYAQAFRILEAVSMFAYLFAGLLLPIFSKMIKQKKTVNKLVKLSFLLLIIPAVILAIASFMYSSEIMELLYHEHSDVSSNIFAILIIGFVFISMTYIFGTLLTANGNLRELNKIAGAGMILNILLNLILIPRYMAFGSAISSLVTQSLTAFAQLIIASRKFKFKINYRLIFTLLAYILCVIVFGISIKHLMTNWLIGLLALLIMSFVFAAAIRLLNFRAIYQILKYDKE